MNGLQHLTIPKSLKFCLALWHSSGPKSSKFGPSCPQVCPNFFHLAKEMAATNSEPEQSLIVEIQITLAGLKRILFNTVVLGIDFIQQCFAVLQELNGSIQDLRAGYHWFDPRLGQFLSRNAESHYHWTINQWFYFFFLYLFTKKFIL